ncbi:MAG: selenocysteine-specific translation elongation factor [bacterium]
MNNPKHLILGTAGHIDHGKTTLIKTLTGYDCDTHQEEKKRGITIHLGFSHINLTSGNSMGIIDVPGHKDFVHTMVGGASGIDMVMMVIAADSGIMPQTVEHLQILEVLGVNQGVVVMTKIDLVDEDSLAIAREDVAEFIKGTFLEKAPVVEVSAKTGKGIDQLMTKLDKLSNHLKTRSDRGIFRMYIDRIFTVKGFGTVVNGSVLSGKICTDQKVYLLPGKSKELRVRRIEKHGEKVDKVQGGDRAALNLVGLDRSDFSRGMVISGEIMNSTSMIDAKLRLFDEVGYFKIWTQVIFHTGTYEQQAKIHLLDRNELNSEEDALVQIHLEKPAVLQPGDKYVIRNTSSDRTLGGGEILDISPLHHRRRPDKLIREIQKIATGELSEIVAAQVRKSPLPLTIDDISNLTNIPLQQLEELSPGYLPEDIKLVEVSPRKIFISTSDFLNLKSSVKKTIKSFIQENPILNRGPQIKEILKYLKIDQKSLIFKVLQYLLEDLTKQGIIEKHTDESWSFPREDRQLDKNRQKDIDLVEEYFRQCDMKTPVTADLKQSCESRGISLKDLNQILKYLTDGGKLYKIEDKFISSEVVNKSRKMLIDYLKKSQKGITVAEFRDLIKGNRKICLLLFSQFDSEKLTIRSGDYRFLNKAKLDDYK